MLAKIHTFGINGVDAYPITIEVDVARGLPATHIVGLPDSAVRESKERVRSAIKNSGFDYPAKRITVNLSPTDTKKCGSAFDLPIALGILAATEQIKMDFLKHFAFMGGLSLDGKVQPIRGAIAVALDAKNKKLKGLVLPHANKAELSIAQQSQSYTIGSLGDAALFLDNPEVFPPVKQYAFNLNDQPPTDIDFSEVKGQMLVKRGLEIAAAGAHNVLLIGPPGSGKSMLAKRLPTILPDMTMSEALETTKIHSTLGYLDHSKGIVRERPFRSPHHTTSDVAIVGGGSIPKPGEATLSHNGVLFLDELPEFRRNVLEALRQPLEDHCVTIARASQTIRFPSKFMFVASMNPCPCGFLTDPKKQCQCSSVQIQKYLSKISGPLLDRIDIHLEVPSLSSFELFKSDNIEKSATVKTRTTKARDIQKKRFCDSKIVSNAYMNHRQLKQFCRLSEECRELLKSAIQNLNLSARAYGKILKVSRTIADLANEETVKPEHVSEAIQYRFLDRDWWS